MEGGGGAKIPVLTNSVKFSGIVQAVIHKNAMLVNNPLQL